MKGNTFMYPIMSLFTKLSFYKDVILYNFKLVFFVFSFSFFFDDILSKQESKGC